MTTSAEKSNATSGPASSGSKGETRRGTGKPREKRSPSALAMKQILKMPLGELAKLAEDLAQHRETAEYFCNKLNNALGATPKG